MKYYIFQRESNTFSDILKDPSLKSKIYEVMTWQSHIRIGIHDVDDALKSYIVLKYGDELRSNLTEDFTPKPGIDYIPKRKK